MSVTAPAGFEAAGLACGLKGSGAADLALVAAAPGPGGRRAAVPAAATFTSNRAAAAPVEVSRAHLRLSQGRAAAVILNSGNANAATGASGLAHAEAMCAQAGEWLGVTPEEVLVCSTGLVGIPLPYEETIGPSIREVVAALAGDPDAAEAAARAIMTTDTRTRQVVVRGPGYMVGGMAKGAAMLAPDMATMLAVLTTDARATPEGLAEALRAAVRISFNELSVDGCCSTNDTVIVLASGLAGTASPARLADSLTEACASLASQMANDAEGKTVVAHITVTGAASDAEAMAAARRVAESQLVQCSLHGRDPYWGRVVSELGSAGVDFELSRVSVAYGATVVCRDGAPAAHDSSEVKAHLAGDQVEITANLGLGDGRASIVTTDLSPAYIAENMRTS
ncbi:MAG: bifunctional glutamate N-acetyltransferase/amino-acid acetyltransferase ArgJ [Candidatus Dormibacteria bacterium]